MIFVGIVMLVGWLVQKSREKGGREGTTTERTQSSQPRQRDMLVDVRKFFEEIQEQEAPKEPPVSGHPGGDRRRRAAAAVEAMEGEEGPAGQQGMTVAEHLKHQQVAEAAKVTRVFGGVKPEASSEPASLEQLVGDVRLSAGARAVILMEIMGTPRALRPYHSTAEEH